MGSAADVVIVGGSADLLNRARAQLAHLERCWTRFSPHSDISRINRAQGEPVEVDSSTIRLVTAMVSGWVVTHGAFDPSQLAPLVGLGYATSWQDPTALTSLAASTSLRTPLDRIRVDHDRSVVVAPAGTGLDAGGIGKGLAADMVVESLLAGGADGALVSVGGDVRVAGSAPHPGGWTVTVRGTGDARNDVWVHLHDGGVATSGTQRRTWTDDAGRRRHHLIDPATSHPVVEGHGLVPVVEASVIAGTGAWAEAWTKAVLVGGWARALPGLAKHGLAARIVHADGSVECNDAWHTFNPVPVPT